MRRNAGMLQLIRTFQNLQSNPDNEEVIQLIDIPAYTPSQPAKQADETDRSTTTNTSQPNCHLLQLPTILIFDIAKFLDPLDLACLSLTSRPLSTLLERPSLLKCLTTTEEHSLLSALARDMGPGYSSCTGCIGIHTETGTRMCLADPSRNIRCVSDSFRFLSLLQNLSSTPPDDDDDLSFFTDHVEGLQTYRPASEACWERPREALR